MVIKRGKRIYDIIKIEKGFLITKNRETGKLVEMQLPLRVCFPSETFWCVEKDVNLTELESIYDMTRIKTPNGTIRFDGPEDKAKQYAEQIGLKNYEICSSTSESKSSDTPSTSAT